MRRVIPVARLRTARRVCPPLVLNVGSHGSRVRGVSIAVQSGARPLRFQAAARRQGRGVRKSMHAASGLDPGISGVTWKQTQSRGLAWLRTPTACERVRGDRSPKMFPAMRGSTRGLGRAPIGSRRACACAQRRVQQLFTASAGGGCGIDDRMRFDDSIRSGEAPPSSNGPMGFCPSTRASRPHALQDFHALRRPGARMSSGDPLNGILISLDWAERMRA